MLAVVIPCFGVARQILGVLAAIGPEVNAIFVVDDACPERSGEKVQRECADPRVKVLFHPANQGVGGAMVTGFRAALEAGARIVVKVDGDGQMNPKLIPRFVAPIAAGQADYAKGNRFHRIDDLKAMPKLRLLGNTGLSFLTKLATGYWDLMDPTNGFFAVHASALKAIPLEKIERGYFFETDMLFRLNTARAVARDVPMRAVYENEVSHLSISSVLVQFPPKLMACFAKRIFYNYFLRDFNWASLQLLLGIPLIVFGTVFGAVEWYLAARQDMFSSSGTVMLASLPIILGFQMLLSAAQYDLQNVPKEPLQRSGLE